MLKVKASLEEITSATQFKARSALLFLFIVLQECVCFFQRQLRWEFQYGMGKVKAKKLKQKSPAMIALSSLSFGANVGCR